MSDISCYNIQSEFVFKAITTLMQLKPSLDSLEEQSVNLVLFKAIDKLAIVQHMLPDPQGVWGIGYKSPALHLTLRKLELPENQESDGVLLLKKVQKCRYFLQHALEETTQELFFQGTSCYLEYIICCENLNIYDGIVVNQNYLNIKQTIDHINQKMIVLRETFEKTRLYLSDMTESCLEQAVVNAWVQGQTLVRHTEFSQQARIDLNNYKFREKENAAVKALDSYDSEAVEENKVSVEIENHIVLVTSELQKKLTMWTARYNEEVETLDVALLQIKSKMDEQKQKYEKLLEQYNSRQELLDIMQEELDRRDRETALILVQNRSALIIQVWWRSILFRRFLKHKILLKKRRLTLELKKKKNKK